MSKPHKINYTLYNTDGGIIYTAKGANVIEVFKQAVAEKVDLTNLRLRLTRFEDIQLDGVLLNGADLSSSEFIRVQFDNVQLRGANLSSSSFRGCNLNNTDISGADMNGSINDRSSLYNVKAVKLMASTSSWNKSVIRNSNFQRGYLTEVNFTGTWIVDTNLSFSDLRFSNFLSANLTNSDFNSARIEHAIFDRSILTGTILSNINFKKLSKWLRRWTNNKRNVKQFRPVWVKIDKQVESLIYCECGNACISRSQTNQFKEKERKLFNVACLNCNVCTGCCRCFTCTSCTLRKKGKCNNCQTCKGCCKCVWCSNCGEECGVSWCGNCRSCNDRCCKCVGIRFVHMPLQFHSPNRMQHKDNSTSRFISVEIEVAGVYDRYDDKAEAFIKTAKNWSASVVKDGSLPAEGFEINTSPAGGDLFVRQVNEICGKLHNAGAYVTDKCGLHVHVDARDFKYYDIQRLIKIYAAIEMALFAMSPVHRLNSRYCYPCGKHFVNNLSKGTLDYKKVRKEITKGVYGTEDTKGIKTRKYNDSRYNALNIHSWFFRGTVECRMFEGTITANDIIDWGILWAKIMDYSLSANDKDVEELSNNTYKALISVVNSSPRLIGFINRRIGQMGHTVIQKLANLEGDSVATVLKDDIDILF